MPVPTKNEELITVELTVIPPINKKSIPPTINMAGGFLPTMLNVAFNISNSPQ